MSTSARRITIAATGFLIVAGFFLATEHRAHVFGFLPFLLLLACPLLHLVAHGRHGGHGQALDNAVGGPGRTASSTGHAAHSSDAPSRGAP